MILSFSNKLKTHWYFVFLILLVLVQVKSLAQGVPKAYERINYRGTVSGKLVRLVLANGYIGASSLELSVSGQKRSEVFQPEAGVADEQNRLKFIPLRQNDHGYFVLDNMQEAYAQIPSVIPGAYFLNDKKILIKFHRSRKE